MMVMINGCTDARIFQFVEVYKLTYHIYHIKMYELFVSNCLHLAAAGSLLISINNFEKISNPCLFFFLLNWLIAIFIYLQKSYHFSYFAKLPRGAVICNHGAVGRSVAVTRTGQAQTSPGTYLALLQCKCCENKYSERIG